MRTLKSTNLGFPLGKALESLLGEEAIDKQLQDQMVKEEGHWKEVLHCAVDAVMFLAKQGN